MVINYDEYNGYKVMIVRQVLVIELGGKSVRVDSISRINMHE